VQAQKILRAKNMSRIFRRPMFRKGGEAMTGIMNNVTPRVNHKLGTPGQYVTDYTEQLRQAAGPSSGVDPLTAWLLRAGPKLMNEPKRGGNLATIFRATAEPTEEAIGDINKRAMNERDLRLAGAQMGLTQHGKASLLEQRLANQEPELSLIDKQIMERAQKYVDEGSNQRIAENMANYDFVIGPKMIETFSQDLVIDSDLVPDINANDRVKRKFYEENEGKYFYDSSTGLINKIIKDPADPTKKGLALETYDSQTFQPIDDSGSDIDLDETVDDISVTLSWEDAQTEATKRGLTLLPPMPEGAGRGWLSTQKRQNPEAITVRELEEIIKKEKFAERYKHIKKKQRVR
jgi:hypothetical protein